MLLFLRGGDDRGKEFLHCDHWALSGLRTEEQPWSLFGYERWRDFGSYELVKCDLSFSVKSTRKTYNVLKIHGLCSSTVKTHGNARSLTYVGPPMAEDGVLEFQDKVQGLLYIKFQSSSCVSTWSMTKSQFFKGITFRLQSMT